ncbi:hypothetical protein JW752_02750 [Candidatus Peregrinibacteria bacterium]|nr:hypothetical protein [Candidatus Peregrinibacteria bacterium]
MPKKTKKKTLPVAPDDMCFWVNNGSVLKDLKELHQALSDMADETFAYHVNQEKNDFARWTEDVLKELDLAKKLMKVKTRKAAIKALDTYFKEAGF